MPTPSLPWHTLAGTLPPLAEANKGERANKGDRNQSIIAPTQELSASTWMPSSRKLAQLNLLFLVAAGHPQQDRRAPPERILTEMRLTGGVSERKQSKCPPLSQPEECFARDRRR